MSERSLDWPGLMRAGLHGAGLRPWEFWALTPVELMVILGRDGGAKGLGRAEFENLLASFPDHSAPEGGNGDKDG